MTEGQQDRPPLTVGTLSDEQLKALVGPLNPQRVKSRSQGGQTLAYVEAWDIKATLIRVFGFGGFSAEVIQSQVLDMRAAEIGSQKRPGVKVSCQATVRLTIPALDCVYTETAIGGSQQVDVTEALDMAMKTAESDALKRAAIYLGTQFGLSLYNNGSKADVVRKIIAPHQRYDAEAQVDPQVQQALEQRLGKQAEPNGREDLNG